MGSIAVAHSFDVALKWDDETHSGSAYAGSRMPVFFGAPPEFGGTDAVWSPEHLLAASLASCYATTFSHFAKLLKVSISDFHISCKAEFEKGKTGFAATRFVISPSVKIANPVTPEILDNLFEKAKKYCLISNSVKGEILVEPSVATE
jgi:organic hydroperoxide reductase OsmC/OhrA